MAHSTLTATDRPKLESAEAHFAGSRLATILHVQWALAIACAYLVLFGRESGDEHGLGPLVVAGFLATNLVLGPLMALVLGAYAYGLWNLRRWVLSLSIAYAFYVPVNLILFGYFHRTGEAPSLAFSVVYLAFALGGSLGTALYLAYHRERLA